MSGSIGVAVFPGDGENPTELLRSADQAMYESKKLARGGARRYKAEASREQVETKIPRTEMETVTGEDVASVTR
jgi:GGDEF domain-containing protein